MKRSLILFLGITLLSSLVSLADALDSWTKVASTPYGGYFRIIYANGFFVALSRTNSYAYPTPIGGYSVSADGVHWAHNSAAPFYEIAFGNGVFTAVAPDQLFVEDGGAIYLANPASGATNLSFVLVPGLSIASQHSVAFGGGFFSSVGYDYEGIAQGFSSGEGYYSASGTNWNFQSFVSTNVIVSPNSTNYTYTLLASNIFLSGTAYGNGKFVALGFPYNPLTNQMRDYYSSDGIHWTATPASVTRSIPSCNSVRFVNGNFYATPGYFTDDYTSVYTNVYVSSSGTSTWTPMASPFPSIYASGTFSNGLYVAAHPGYPLSTSTDGVTWSSRNTGLTNILTDVAYDGKAFVICTADGSLYRSASTTPTVSARRLLANGSIQITVSNGIGPSYQLQASTNLVNWSNIYTFSSIQATNSFIDASATNFTRRYYRTVAQ